MSPQVLAELGGKFHARDRGAWPLRRRPTIAIRTLLPATLCLIFAGSAAAAPSPPTGLTATPGDRKVTLTWNPAPSSENVAGYNIYEGEHWTYLGDPGGADSFVDSGLTNGVSRSYRVEAYTDDRPPITGTASGWVTATPVAGAPPSPPPPPPPPPALLPAPPTGTCSPGFGAFTVDVWPAACWRPYSATHFLNRAVPAGPAVHPSSASIVARMQAMGAPIGLYAWANPANGWDYYHPVYYSMPTDPLYTANAIEPWDCEIDERSFRIPVRARRASGTDAHMTVIDQQAGLEYDMWQVKTGVLPAAGGRFDVGCGGVVRMLDDFDLYSSASAGEWGLMGGQITAAELRAGTIDHALFATVQCSAPQPVRPARLLSTGFTCPTGASTAPAIGQRLWLQMTPAEIAALAVPEWKRTIFRALAKYGAYVGDNGGGPNALGLQLESDMSYTALGRPGRIHALAAELKAAGTAGINLYQGDYTFDMATGFPWSRLRVLTPPAS